MKCPNCGAPEKARVKVCRSCGEAYASQDLLELRQLEFLIEETAGWEVAERLRSPYAERLAGLRARLERRAPVQPEAVPETIPAPPPEPAEPVVAVPEPAVEAVPTPAPEPVVEEPEPAVTPRPAPPREREREKVPFDQWLLSERNIKIALYSGGALLVLAGLIFIGVKWGVIPGPGKFAITLMITGLMYLGGYLLFQRSAYRIGGVALLGVASGFLTLNFAVLQIYVLGPSGLRNDVMWLIASPLCLLLYILTAYWTRGDLFTYISLAAAGSTLTAALVVIEAPLLAFALAYSLLGLAILALARFFQSTPLVDFTRLPLLIVSHGAMPFVIVAALVGWMFAADYSSTTGSPWLVLLSLGVGVLFYVTTDTLFKWLAARWAAAVLFPVAFSLVLIELGFSDSAFLITLMVLALAYLGVGYVLERREGRRAGGWPLYATSCAVAVSMSFLAFPSTGDLAIVLFGDVVLLVVSGVLFKRLEMRWGAALLFPVFFSLALVELNFGDTAAGIALMVLALAYLGVGYTLERLEGRRAGGWPLYATAYVVAAFVTFQAISETDDLALALIGDVILLAVSAAIHRDYWWVYGAVWLFMLPVYLFISLLVPTLHHQGLLMGVLGLNYVAAGYALGRRELRLGGPFLTAAAFLSIVTVGLTWGNPIVASLVLALVAALYLLAALWLDWTWLLLPALLAVNLAVFAVNRMFFEGLAALGRALIISYAALGVVLGWGGWGLRRAREERWVWPLYLVGAVDLAGAYLAGLFFGGWLAVGLSGVLAVLLLAFAWLERAAFTERKFPPVLAYLGVGAVFAGQFYMMGVIGGSRAWDVWPGYTAGLCASFVALAWLLRREPLVDIYATPLRRAGLWLMAVPMAGSVYVSVFVSGPLVGAVAFAIAGLIYAGDAALRRILNLAYLATGAFVVAIWAMLIALDISEPQAYVIPLGLALLGAGWNERRRGKDISYRLATLLGLVVLMGSAFDQSLPRRAYGYAVLLGVESLMSVGWGIRTRSRGYVQVGAVALIVNAIAQLGPSFVELPRWVQIGVTGAILLGGGLAALFKREQILATRRRLTDEWRQWEP